MCAHGPNGFKDASNKAKKNVTKMTKVLVIDAIFIKKLNLRYVCFHK